MKNYIKIYMLVVLICSTVGVYADRPTIGVMDISAKGLSSEDAASFTAYLHDAFPAEDDGYFIFLENILIADYILSTTISADERSYHIAIKMVNRETSEIVGAASETTGGKYGVVVAINTALSKVLDAAKNPDSYEKSGDATRRLLRALVFPVALGVLALTFTFVLVFQAL